MSPVKLLRQTTTVSSDAHVQLLDITKRVRDIVLQAEVRDGILLVNSLHTTCALFVNEFQGALAHDLKAMLERLVVDDGAYKHDDPRYSDCERGNACSHLPAHPPRPQRGPGDQRRRALGGPIPVHRVCRVGRPPVSGHRRPGSGAVGRPSPVTKTSHTNSRSFTGVVHAGRHERVG